MIYLKLTGILIQLRSLNLFICSILDKMFRVAIFKPGQPPVQINMSLFWGHVACHEGSIYDVE